MLETLRSTPCSSCVPFDEEFLKDLHWFQMYMPRFNGTSMMCQAALELKTEHPVDLDACLRGCGGVYGRECYATEFPSPILQVQRPIHQLEMLNAVVAARL